MWQSGVTGSPASTVLPMPAASSQYQHERNNPDKVTLAAVFSLCSLFYSPLMEAEPTCIACILYH